MESLPPKLLGWEEDIINGMDASCVSRGHIVPVDLFGGPWILDESLVVGII